MKVVVVGAGGREHALAHSLGRSSRVSELFFCPGNGGMAQLGECWDDLAPTSEAFLDRVRERGIQWVVIGPEAPLVDGLADRCRAAGLGTFGPGASASQLEGSKAFAKEFMERHGIPTARHAVVTRLREVESVLAQFDGPTVVKADGLAAGKGVVVTANAEQAMRAAQEMLEEDRFGTAGRRVVIEERLEGVEMTQLVFVSGHQSRLLQTAQDYKPLLDGNQGPNTGGMGSYSPTTLVDGELQARIENEIVEPTLAGLATDGIEYKGILYVGLMLTAEGPRVLEYNVRFGDPETQPLLMRLKTDLLDVFEAIENETLDQVELAWDDRAALCLVLASAGYPESYEKGVPINGEVQSEPGDTVQVFHAGTRCAAAGQLVTSGGRVLGVTALGADLEEARSLAYARANAIEFEGKIHRGDIGVFGTEA